MELQTAINLVYKAVPKTTEPQQWADLGSGKGLFVHALSTLLPRRSSILALDNNGAALQSIRIKNPDISLITQTADFTKLTTDSSFDGILMANSLHYVQDQIGFLSKLRKQLKSNGNVVIIEYERTQPNPWVPHPIPFHSLNAIALKAGFKSIRVLEEVPSAYDKLKIYSALLR